MVGKSRLRYTGDIVCVDCGQVLAKQSYFFLAVFIILRDTGKEE